MLTISCPGAPVTSATSVTVAESPTWSVPVKVQVTVGATDPHSQPGPPAETKVRPLGSGSVRTIGALVAFGPVLVTVSA
jgi:hypothetical protein